MGPENSRGVVVGGEGDEREKNVGGRCLELCAPHAASFVEPEALGTDSLSEDSG